jgi:RNA polymerase sigma-70 factor (ECF subfamily)
MLWTRSQSGGAEVAMAEPMDRADWTTAAVLHERYLDELFRYVLRRVSRVQEAEDITAEVFAAAAAGLPRFRGQVSPYLWLLGIARRKIADALRRRERRREELASELDEGSPEGDPLWETLVAVEGPEAALVRAEARGEVRALIAHLNGDQREAVLLRYMEQLSIAEIAVVMGRSEAAATGLLQRARAALYRHGRAYFLGEGGGNER